MNKRLIAIFASLAAVVVLVVLSCVIFIIGDVTVRLSVGMESSPELREKIIQDSKIAKYSSIFGLSEEKATANIESANPSIRVLDIERKAPNVVQINVAYRTPMLCALTREGVYALLDRDLKVIRIVDAPQTQDWGSRWNGVTLQDAREGVFIAEYDWLKALLGAAEQVGLSKQRFGAFIVELHTDETTAYLLTNTGATLCVYKNADAAQAAQLLRGAYNAYLNAQGETAHRRDGGYWRLGAAGWEWTPALV